MAEKDSVFKGKVKHQGPFGFKDFYEFLFGVFMDEGFNVFESKYEEVNKGNSKDIHINWEAIKNVSKYFQFKIEIEYLILRMEKIKIKKDGQEISTESGSLEIKFKAVLIKDPDSEWDNTFMKKLREIYDKHIIRSRIEEHEEELSEKINEIISIMKSYLAIEGQHNW
ncbi:hypothetical protein CMI38_02825 [Candidatus Pacearchaeota archaeon]|nr:hypothetical protein [Candidatus Pacearchaeota archaeon]|tara:strand:- start:2563 stop:3066 length:504 start_codon:yes stop_codon:yes gene_type:complete